LPKNSKKWQKNTSRIVYAFYKREGIVEFIEIYFKGDKENEDRSRINKYLSKFLI